MNEPIKPNTVPSVDDVVTRLRDSSCGRDVWRVQDKDDKSYCIQFDAWEKAEAVEWWQKHRDREFHANHELASVRIHSREDLIMQEAAETLEFFFGQMQAHDVKMDGQHRYRFVSGGWPMTHCVGPNAVAAVNAAMQEIRRSRSESA